MPANVKILAKYKSYVGRIFTLRKTKTIPGSLDDKAKDRKIFDREEVFGDCCLITDERNTRVQVISAFGTKIWISKYYLHKELPSKEFQEHDYVIDLSDKLLDLGQVFEDLLNEGKEAKETINKVVGTLRTYADTLKK